MKKAIFGFVGTVAEWRKIQDIRKQAEEKRRKEKMVAWFGRVEDKKITIEV